MTAVLSARDRDPGEARAVAWSLGLSLAFALAALGAAALGS